MRQAGTVNERGPGVRVAPLPFLTGVVGAFLVCCAVGRLTADRNCFTGFVRFHQAIRSETLFFPTASEVRALGRARLDPDKIAVVVGGNSILYGYGQPRSENWTYHLQAALGDRFCVLNLAQPGAHPPEFGEIAAEMLERDHYRLVFITDCGSPAPGLEIDPDGNEVGRSFFWDAYYKEMIAADARRDAQLKEVAAQRTREDKGDFAELRRGQRLDAALWFQDMWTRVAYSHVSTVGSPQMMTRSFLRPRRSYSELDPPLDPTLEQRYPRLRRTTRLSKRCATGSATVRVS
jgi:hypothetical protein